MASGDPTGTRRSFNQRHYRCAIFAFGLFLGMAIALQWKALFCYTCLLTDDKERGEEGGPHATSTTAAAKDPTPILITSSPLNKEEGQEATPPSLKTIFVYVCNDLQDLMQLRKIKELYEYFGENLWVVTDFAPRPSSTDRSKHLFLPNANDIIDPSRQKCTSQKLWNHKGCGLERAIMWLKRIEDTYDHAWIMEDDCYWKNFSRFQEFLEAYKHDDTDLLHQNVGMEDEPIEEGSKELNWWNLPWLRYPKVLRAAEIQPPYYHGLFMFYRTSNRTVKKLHEWRIGRNNGEWTFFEPLLSVLPVQDPNLTTKTYIENEAHYGFKLNYRPCFEKDDIYGNNRIYEDIDFFHPVKKNYKACTA